MKTLLYSFILVLASIPASALELNKSVKQSVILKTGFVSYTIEGFRAKTGTNSTNAAIEYVNHSRKDHGLFFGYRLMQFEGSARSEYQAGYAGYRLYPFTLAVPVQTLVNNSTVNYSFSFMPYFDLSGSVGRRLIETKGETGGLEVSSEFYGIGFGTGVQYAAFDFLSFDLGLTYEVMNGFGPVLMSGTNIMVMLGFNYYI